MPQLQLPFFPQGVTEITANLTLIHTIEKEILPRLEVQQPAFANATPSVEQTTAAYDCSPWLRPSP